MSLAFLGSLVIKLQLVKEILLVQIAESHLEDFYHLNNFADVLAMTCEDDSVIRLEFSE